MGRDQIPERAGGRASSQPARAAENNLINPATRQRVRTTEGDCAQDTAPHVAGQPADDWRAIPDFPGYECRPPNHVRSIDHVVETKRGPRHYRGVTLRIVGRSVWLYRNCQGHSFCATRLVRDVWGAEVAA
jgi:hypothetical protein